MKPSKSGTFRGDALPDGGRAKRREPDPAPEMTMRKSAFYALIATVGLASGAADAAIATFHCDAAPVQECHYVVFDNNTPRAAQRVSGGQSLVVKDVRGTDTYCRSVDGDPDTSSCSRQPVPLDADFHDRVDTSNQPSAGIK